MQTGAGGWCSSYRPQHRVHELVRLFGPHQAAHFEHANGEAGDDGGMLLERLLQDLAILVVVLERADLGHAAESLKGAQVQLVDMGEVRVGDDDIGQRLDVTQAVGDSTGASAGGANKLLGAM